MEEILNVVNDTQEQVVDAPETLADEMENESGGMEDVSGKETQQEEAPQPEAARPAQSKELNARFAQMRREAQSARMEAERAREEAERLKRAVSLYGYEGETADIADALEASKRGMTTEALRLERAQKQAELEKAMESSPIKKQLEAENETLKRTLNERIYREDMEAIKKVYPECAAKSVFELGDDFVRLRAAGVSAIVAYEAMQGAKAKTIKPAPPSTGSVKSSAPIERDYFTPEEVDKLTSRELDDPKVMDKVLKSMARWKK